MTLDVSPEAQASLPSPYTWAHTIPYCGQNHPVVFWPSYGFVIMSIATTNGNGGIVRQFVKTRCPYLLEDFDLWASTHSSQYADALKAGAL